MRQMKVVLHLHGERGAFLLDGEMFVELLVSWLGCVHVMRERLGGQSRAKRHVWLSRVKYRVRQAVKNSR